MPYFGVYRRVTPYDRPHHLVRFSRQPLEYWDRVEEACRGDRSIAVAHGLEAVCEVPPPEGVRKQKKVPKKSATPKKPQDDTAERIGKRPDDPS